MGLQFGDVAIARGRDSTVARGRDWGVLHGDPAPGDPGSIQQVAESLGRAVTATDDAAVATGDVALEAGTGGWSGPSAGGFLTVFGQLPAVVLHGSARAGSAGSALSAWADALVVLQARAGALLDLAEAADQRRTDAEALRPDAQQARASALDGLRWVQRDPDATDDARSAAWRRYDRADLEVVRLDRAVAEAEGALGRLRTRARALGDEHHDAVRGSAIRVSACVVDPTGRPSFGRAATGGGLLDGSAGIVLDADGDGTVDPDELAAALAFVLGDNGMSQPDLVAAMTLLGQLLMDAAADPSASAAVIEALRLQGLDGLLADGLAVGNPVIGTGFIGPLTPLQAALRSTLVDPLLALVAGANDPSSWRWLTHLLADLDADAWDPTRGLAPLDGIAVDAWTFYQDLFAADPNRYLWSGMATLAGGTFYAAFQDLHVLRVGLQSGEIPVEEAVEILTRHLGPFGSQLAGELADAGADALANELAYVETTFLDMQKQIFDDLAWQHVAHRVGGMAGLEQLADDGMILPLQLEAWRAIDSGVPDRVEAGNASLLRHEQSTIIGDDYDAIRDHSPTTWALTMGMSVLASSPVPGGRPFREVVPLEVGAWVDTPDRVTIYPDRVGPLDLPFGGLSIDTPDRIGGSVDLPLNNVSIFAHRWQWIEQDMLPAWIDHVHDGTAGPLVAVPIADQAVPQRLVPDVGPRRYDPAE